MTTNNIIGTIHSLTIDGYSSEGLGVARIPTNGGTRVIFVSGMDDGKLPGVCRGDICKVEITAEKRGLLFGKVTGITEPSNHRAENDCSAFPHCGGCNFRHMTYDEELFSKTSRVRDALRRIGRVNLEPEAVLGAPEIIAYRNKASYHIGLNPLGAVAGVYRGKSREIIPVNRCLLQEPAADTIAAALRGFINRSNYGFFTALTVRIGTNGDILVIVETTGRENFIYSELTEALRNAEPRVIGVIWTWKTAEGKPREKLLWGRDYITEEICGLTLHISSGAFSQINTMQVENLYNKALEYAGELADKTITELYCGVGFMALLTAKYAKRVYGVDIDSVAVKDARRNAAANGIENTAFIVEDAARAMSELGENEPIVIVDPPRRGLTREVIDAVVKAEPKRVIYLSCDPATLARDIRLFTEKGYILRKYAVVDMFPRTANVETVCLIEK